VQEYRGEPRGLSTNIRSIIVNSRRKCKGNLRQGAPHADGTAQGEQKRKDIGRKTDVARRNHLHAEAGIGLTGRIGHKEGSCHRDDLTAEKAFVLAVGIFPYGPESCV